MGKPIVPSGGRPPVSGSGRSLDRRGPGQLSYEEADDIGFDVVPMQIRKALRSRSLIGSQALAADGRDPIVKRRADGTCYQTGDAWWGDETRLLVIDYRRDMEQIGERQFRPAGAWRVEGQLSRLGGVGGPEHSTWSYDAAGTTGGAGRTPKTHDPLDILPPDLARPVREGVAAAWKTWNSKSADETVVAMYCTNERVLLLRSVREASSRRALALADWHAETLNAPVTEREIVKFVGE